MESTEAVQMSPEIQRYYHEIRIREPTRSDASLFPSYTNLTVPYRVLCRQRYRKAGIIQRRQFLKEIAIQEALQPRALDGVRQHREFCDYVLKEPDPESIVKFTPKDLKKIQTILDRSF